MRHGLGAPCIQGTSNMKAGIQYSYSLPTHYAEPCEKLMGPCNISKHLDSCVLFRASCKVDS